MILDTVRGYECRHATAEELGEMYDLLEPLVCDYTEHKNTTEMNQRKLRKYLKHAVKTNQAIVVAKGDVLTSVYAGDDEVIVYMGTKGTDVISTALLMHTILNRMHNRFTESAFLVANKKQRKAWDVTALGDNAVEINELGIGTVKLVAKEKIERLYTALKG